ncbi:MAG: hypothetical protein RLZZ46_1018 [Bacteroidota bacterium]
MPNVEAFREEIKLFLESNLKSIVGFLLTKYFIESNNCASVFEGKKNITNDIQKK